MRVLVTGGTGFIGRAVVEALSRAGHDVRVLARDSRRAAAVFHGIGTPPPEVVAGEPIDRTTVERALVNCDALVQAAAVYSYERRDAKRTLAETPALARSVLGAALGVGTPHVVDISSTVVFSLDEPRFDEATPLARADRPGWDDPYLQAKVLAELAGRELALNGLPRVTIHPSMTVGPGDLGPGTSGGLLIRLLGSRMFFRGRMGWVDVREVADAVVAALDARPGANYILSGTVESLSGIARRLDRLTGHRRLRAFPPARMALRLATDNDRLGAPLRGLPTPGTLQIMARFPSVVDGSRAERELGIHYRPLDETLADAIRWWVAKGMLDRRTAGHLAMTPPPASASRST